MALEDILFSEGTNEGQPFLVEVLVVSTGPVSDILTESNTFNDSLTNELYKPTVVVDNRRRVR